MKRFSDIPKVLFLSCIVLFLALLHLTAHLEQGCFAAKQQNSSSSHLSGAPVSPLTLEVTDKYNRLTPRSTVEGFLAYASEGDFQDAAYYLDLRYLPSSLKDLSGAELARRLYVVLTRAANLDIDSISANPGGNRQDGLSPNLERIARIKTPEKSVDILLELVPRKDGVKIWNFSHKTVAQIPLLYKYYGLRPFEKKLSRFFPDTLFLGWHVWQWVAYLIFVGVAFFVAWVLTWLLFLLIKIKKGKQRIETGKFIKGPLRIVLWLYLSRLAAEFLMPSAEVAQLLNAGTIFTIALCWAGIKALDILYGIWSDHLEEQGHGSTVVLLRPLRTVVRISFVIVALLLWLDNMGFKVSALLAGLGVGGLAVALAAQGVLKNLLGTVMILADRPYNVGERIVVKGYDGEVEEIGLRSTKIRLLTGHQASIPNDEIERSPVENIGRRPHIRRKQDIRLAMDTPPEKAERAVEIIRELLENHEGMRKSHPPRVFFDKFSDDGLNIVMYYWYHPAQYWNFLDFSQKLNTAILWAFEKEGIRLALPSSTSYVQGAKDGEPVRLTSLEEDTKDGS